MALALNKLKRVDMPLNKETNQPKQIINKYGANVSPCKIQVTMSKMSASP